MQKWNLVPKAAAALIVGSLALTGCTTTGGERDNAATSASKHQAIDSGVDATLSRLYSTVKGSHELVGKSRGVLVFPDVLQAGFIVGGQSGNGALRVLSGIEPAPCRNPHVPGLSRTIQRSRYRTRPGLCPGSGKSRDRLASICGDGATRRRRRSRTG